MVAIESGALSGTGSGAMLVDNCLRLERASNGEQSDVSGGADEAQQQQERKAASSGGHLGVSRDAAAAHHPRVVDPLGSGAMIMDTELGPLTPLPRRYR